MRADWSPAVVECCFAHRMSLSPEMRRPLLLRLMMMMTHEILALVLRHCHQHLRFSPVRSHWVPCKCPSQTHNAAARLLFQLRPWFRPHHGSTGYQCQKVSCSVLPCRLLSGSTMMMLRGTFGSSRAPLTFRLVKDFGLLPAIV